MMTARQQLNKCTECGGIFQKKQYLNSHIRRFHKNISLPTKKRNLDGSSQEGLCNVCGLMFATRKILLHHIENHKIGKPVKNAIRLLRIKCPVEQCTDMVKSYKTLRKHIEEVHNVKLDCQKFTFNSQEEFEEWKDKIQQETLSFYARDCGSNMSSNGKKRYYANCHRSYDYKNRGKNLKTMKTGGTNKIGKACPSRLEISESNGVISVKWWSTHIGHTCEPHRMFLSKRIRDEIAKKLLEGETIDKILSEFHKMGLKERLQRLECLTRRDIFNIIRDYHINYKPKKEENVPKDFTFVDYNTEYGFDEDEDDSLSASDFKLDEERSIELDGSKIENLSDETQSFQNIIREKTDLIVALSEETLTKKEKESILIHFEKIIDILCKEERVNTSGLNQNVGNKSHVFLTEESKKANVQKLDMQPTSSRNDNVIVDFLQQNEVVNFYVDFDHDYF